MGSPCRLHSPCHHSIFSSSLSSPPPYLHPPLLSLSSSPLILAPRNAQQNRKKLRPAAALVQAETKNDGVFRNRRMILFTGISFLPLLQLRARALEEPLADSPELKATDEEPEVEQRTIQGSESQNPFLFLLNVIGLCGSGVLGGLYVLARKDKAKTDASLDSIRGEMEEKEATIVSMEKRVESELLKEKEERIKQQKKASEDQQVLLNRLCSANSTINDLEREVQNEKKFVEDLKIAKHRLEGDLRKAGEEKNKLEAELKDKLGSIEVLHERMNLLSMEVKDNEEKLEKSRTLLTEKEAELQELSSLYQQSQSKLQDLTSEKNELKDEILKNERGLELKNAEVHSLEVQLNSLVVERNELKEKHDAIKNDYNNLKLTTENKAASDAQLLEEHLQRLQQLQEQLVIASDEVNRNKELITDLTLEKVDLKKALDEEIDAAKNLEHELHIAQGNLENSRNETHDLKNQLEQSRDLCSRLEAEVTRVRSDIVETTEALQKNIDETRRGAELLASDLTATKELLRKANEEVQIITQELVSVSDTRDNLQKELVDVYKKAESAAYDLKEERNVVANLNKELQVLETQMLRDKEAHKSLEADLEEATKSLVEMNQNATVLSKDLELSMSTISLLEDEKQMLRKSLVEQKQVSQEAQENMEDAHNLVMRLGKERENLERRGKKLEEELASAKGEILRLRSQMNSSIRPVNDELVKADDKATVSARRYTRKRKSVPDQDDDS
ncbi:hypothetical protein DM860_014990 [Cuscuta australis]|uniref:MAR-binding filament-like protein 1-1 n=1 Tax=Cuscuta australis TaxID=267555 RepID=A0A328DIE8_9ASTE|nr:hypothetical protein DM860_014990 [Cuscuta australis]